MVFILLDNVDTEKMWGMNWLFVGHTLLRHIWVYMVKTKIIGIVFIPLGLLIAGAYIYLLYGVSTGNADNLPKGAFKWCCYGTLVWSCIETYRQELSSEQFHHPKQIQA